MSLEFAMSLVGLLSGLVAAIWSWTAKRQVARVDKLEQNDQARALEQERQKVTLAYVQGQASGAPNAATITGIVETALDPIKNDLRTIKTDVSDLKERMVRQETLVTLPRPRRQGGQ